MGKSVSLKCMQKRLKIGWSINKSYKSKSSTMIIRDCWSWSRNLDSLAMILEIVLGGWEDRQRTVL